MATKKVPYQYYLKIDKSSNPKRSGKYYAKRFNPTVLGTRGLAEHMIGHGLIAERSEVEHVLNALQTCIPELLQQGMNVKLQGLGTFRANITGRGAASIDAYSVQKHMKGIRMRFIPDQTRDLLSCIGYTRLNVFDYREAGWVIDSVVLVRLMDRAAEANNKTILFTMGMYGCGKTTSINNNHNNGGKRVTNEEAKQWDYTMTEDLQQKLYAIKQSYIDSGRLNAE